MVERAVVLGWGPHQVSLVAHRIPDRTPYLFFVRRNFRNTSERGHLVVHQDRNR
jgi:hypothetical protein